MTDTAARPDPSLRERERTSFLALWDSALQEHLRVALLDDSMQGLFCLTCSRAWLASIYNWERTESGWRLPGWWCCPNGCNRAAYWLYPDAVRAIEAQPPWEPLSTPQLGGVTVHSPTTCLADVPPAAPRRGPKPREERLRQDPELRQRVQNVRDEYATGRYTLDGLARRLPGEPVSGRTVRRWLDALRVVENDEASAR